jgi:hypothetical protein
VYLKVSPMRDLRRFKVRGKLAPFEMLYGRRCRTPLFWSEAKERKIFGPDILQEAEKQVHMVRENL